MLRAPFGFARKRYCCDEKTRERILRLAKLRKPKTHRLCIAVVWDPFMKKPEVEIKVGNELRMYLQTPGGRGMAFHPIVLTVIPAKEEEVSSSP